MRMLDYLEIHEYVQLLDMPVLLHPTSWLFRKLYPVDAKPLLPLLVDSVAGNYLVLHDEIALLVVDYLVTWLECRVALLQRLSHDHHLFL